MPEVRTYPPKEAEKGSSGAVIAEVCEDSPADDAGIYAGCIVRSVNGEPVADVLDWQWKSAEECLDLIIEEPCGDITSLTLEREADEPWGMAFRDTLFDAVRMCKNTCTFCFMKQLPKGLRRSLYLRDDDYRLSFLQGTFVTLTNLEHADVARIVEQRITPLRVSLHAVDAHVREQLIGRNAAQGLANLEELLEQGIEFDAQIVLVPGVNDGVVLDETIRWAYEHTGIRTLGIVPLGYTDHQRNFTGSFDRLSARDVLDAIAPYQERACVERDYAWVYASDEFYLLAYGDDVLDHLPDAAFYGAFEMFEDGIGIVRSCVDEFALAQEGGVMDAAAAALEKAGVHGFFVCGEGMRPYFGNLIASSPLNGLVEPLFIKNRFFGGNVDVTGLLAGEDIVRALKEAALAWRDRSEHASVLFLLFDVMFNADGITIDGMSLEDIMQEAGERLLVLPSNPLDYTKQLSLIDKEL